MKAKADLKKRKLNQYKMHKIYLKNNFKKYFKSPVLSNLLCLYSLMFAQRLLR